MHSISKPFEPLLLDDEDLPLFEVDPFPVELFEELWMLFVLDLVLLKVEVFPFPFDAPFLESELLAEALLPFELETSPLFAEDFPFPLFSAVYVSSS